MLCVLRADETKAVSKVSAAKMYTILVIREYICQEIFGHIDCYKQIEDINTAKSMLYKRALAFIASKSADRILGKAR
jgi:hypothetical protein